MNQNRDKFRLFNDKFLYANSIGVNDSELLYTKELKFIYENNKKVTLINGCFDLVHPMHISLFNYAKSISDYLVVAINSDEYITKTKGIGRPVHKLKERIEILSSMEDIDFVITFKEDCAGNVLNIIKPTYLVKGPGYLFENLSSIEQESIRYNNIQLRIFPYN